MTTYYPPFAFSLFQRNPTSKGTLAYKVLRPPSGSASSAIPLVLVHGLSAIGLVDWLPLAQQLAETRPVLIFDNRDIGSSYGSEKPRGGWTMQDLADDVIDLITHKGWREVDLLGFSMGGMIVQTVAVTPHLPFKIKHLVLAATSTKPPHSELMQAFPSPNKQANTIEEKKALITPVIHVGYDPKFLADPKNKEIVDKRITQSVMCRRPNATIMRQVEAVSTHDSRKRLPGLSPNLPVLLVHGNLDKSVYFSEQKYLVNALGSRIRRLKTPHDEYGHMWYDYFTIEFWENRLRRFLDDDDTLEVVKDGPDKSKAGKL